VDDLQSEALLFPTSDPRLDRCDHLVPAGENCWLASPQVDLGKMRRVAQRQVIFTWDKQHDEELWIVAEYVPEIRLMEHARFPCLNAVVNALGGAAIREFPIPHDFTDGYQPAFWRRPEAYLDSAIRAASSTFATLPDEIVEPAMRRLQADLASGAWARRHQDFLERDTADYGYRLIVSA